MVKDLKGLNPLNTSLRSVFIEEVIYVVALATWESGLLFEFYMIKAEEIKQAVS